MPRLISRLEPVKGLLIICAIYCLAPVFSSVAASMIIALSAVLRHGIEAIDFSRLDKYALGTVALVGEFSLLSLSGLVAIWASRRYTDVSWYRQNCAWWMEVGWGVAASIAYLLLIKLVVLPCLFYMRPPDTAYNRTFFGITSYSQTSASIIGRAFFIDTVYAPVVETVLFISAAYWPLRQKLAMLPTLLVVAVFFAALHNQTPWFFQYLAFSIVNLSLFEMRKSLLAPATHHVIANMVIYGGQLWWGK